MNLPTRLQPLLLRALPLLVAVAVPLAAVLSFSIQPLLGKQLLPIYGGSAGVWPACVAYFQLALLLGYLWAAWLARQNSTIQTIATAGLGLLAVLTFRLPSTSDFAPVSVTGVIARLALATLPALVLLFSASPLLHGWLTRRQAEVPYYIYALANMAALGALWLYPFAIEPNLRSSEQAFLWQGLLVVAAALLAFTSYLLRHSTQHRHTAADTHPPAATPASSSVRQQLALAALTCTAMLGATGHLVAEIGSSPVAWVGPLGLYLLSFMVVFSGRWQRWMTYGSAAWLLVSLAGYMIAKGFTAATVNGTRAWLVLSVATSACCLGHALLFETRPRARLERFYIVLAAGGLLGALFSAAIVPRIFPQRFELALAALGVFSLGVAHLVGRRPALVGGLTAIVVGAPLLGFGVYESSKEALGGTLVHRRDLHGTLMVKTDDHSVVLSRDGTTHATQITVNAAAHRRPTLYYSESSAVARVLEKLREKRPHLRVGVIGLNGGTLAAYAQPGDTFDFWDISPLMQRTAQENFSYLGDATGTISLTAADGRRVLENSRVDYDLLVVDGYPASGDSLPAHLLTREALKTYLARLAVHDGFLLVNVAARYTNFFPMIEATAHVLGRATIEVTTIIEKPAETRDWDPARSEYAIVTRAERVPAVRAWFPLEEEGGRVKREITAIEGNYIRPQLIWSDDRQAATDIFDLGRVFSSP